MTTNDMMREVIKFAMEEMRNRALEEAAVLAHRRHDFTLACQIRELKRNPSDMMTDWWTKKSEYICDMVPEGA